MKKFLSLVLILALTLTAFGQAAMAEDGCEEGNHNWILQYVINCETGKGCYFCTKCHGIDFLYTSPKPHDYIVEYVPIPGPQINRYTPPKNPGNPSRKLGSGQTTASAAANAPSGAISHLRAGGFSTCTDGYRKQKRCTVCHDIVVLGDYPPMGHSYGDSWKVDPDNPGYEIGTCRRCGNVWTREIEHDHEWGEWCTVTEATREEKGTEERACGICGVTETREVEFVEVPVPEITPAPGPASYFDLTFEVMSAPKNGEYYDYADDSVIRYQAVFTNNAPYDVTIVLSDALGTEFPHSGETLTQQAGQTMHVDYAYGLTPGDVTLGEVKNRFYVNITMPDGSKHTMVSGEMTVPVGYSGILPEGIRAAPDGVTYLDAPPNYDGLLPEAAKNAGCSIILEVVSTPPNGSDAYEVGDTILYRYTVNTARGKIIDYSIRDALHPGEVLDSYYGKDSLPTPRSTIAEYVVMPGDATVGYVVNQATLSCLFAADWDWDYEIYKPSTVDSNFVSVKVGGTKPDIQPMLTETSKPANGEYYVLGETVVYTCTLSDNNGIYQDGIKIVDPFAKLKVLFLNVHTGSTGLTYTHRVTEEDVEAGFVERYFTAIYRPAISTKKRINSNTVTVPTKPADPKLKLEKRVVNTPAVDDKFQPGESIEYEFILSAEDGKTYSGAAIYDDMLGGRIGSLNTAESLTMSYTTTDADAEAGTVTNTAYAVWVNDLGEEFRFDSNTAEAAAAACPRIPDPFEVGDPAVPETGLTVNLKDISDYQNGSFHVPNDTVLFYVEVYNTTDETAYNVTVTDPLFPSGSIAFAEIPPHAEKHFRYPYTVTASNAEEGGIWNTAWADYSDADGSRYSASDTLYVPCHFELPEAFSVSVTKTEVSAYPNGLYYREGEVVQYDLSITNTTGETIYNVAFVDEGVSYEIGTMDPDAYAQVSHLHTVTYIDVGLGSFTNQAYAVWGEDSGKQDKGAVTNTVTVPCGVDEPERHGSVTVSKTVLNPREEYHPGDTIMYSIIVYNGTEEPIYDVEVTDDFTNLSTFTAEPVGSAASIEAGQGAPFFFNHTVTEEDTLGGQLGNSAYILYRTADSDTSYFAMSNFVIVNTAPGEMTDSGEIVVTKYELSIPKNGRYYNEGDYVTFSTVIANPTGLTYTDLNGYDILLEGSGYYYGSQPTFGSDPVVMIINYEVTDIDEILGSVTDVAWADAADPDGIVHTATSNEVTVPVGEGGSASGGNGSYCHTYVSAEGEGILSIRTDYCTAHGKAAEEAAQLMQEGDTAAAKSLWQAALNAAYASLADGADEETAELIAREQAAFELKLTSLAAIYEAEGMDAADIDGMVIEALAERACELCADKAVMNDASVKDTETASVTAPVSAKCTVETVADPMGSTKTITMCMTQRAGDMAVRRLIAAMEQVSEEQKATLYDKILATRKSELNSALTKRLASADAQTKPLIIRYKSVLLSEIDLRSRVLTAIRGEAPAADLLLRIYQTETAFLCGK